MDSLMVEVVVEQCMHAGHVLGSHGSQSLVDGLRGELQRLDVARQRGLGRQRREANLKKMKLNKQNNK